MVGRAAARLNRPLMRRVPLLALAALLAGCAEPPVDPAPEQPTTPAPPAFADADITEDVMGLWSRSCVLCHVHGEANAPRVGDAEAWAPRLAEGEDVLLARTVEGYNDMPPLGYCMACEREDFRALIRFMAAGAP